MAQESRPAELYDASDMKVGKDVTWVTDSSKAGPANIFSAVLTVMTSPPSNHPKLETVSTLPDSRGDAFSLTKNRCLKMKATANR
jgi:hypothetical protein